MAQRTIVGTGTTAQAISGVMTLGSDTVELIGYADGDKPVTGDVVLGDSSAAAEIAAAIPRSRTVKAFKTTNAQVSWAGGCGLAA